MIRVETMIRNRKVWVNLTHRAVATRVWINDLMIDWFNYKLLNFNFLK